MELILLVIGILIGFGFGYLTGMDYEKHSKDTKVNKDNHERD